VGIDRNRKKIVQHWVIICHGKSAKKREPTKIGWKLALNGTGRGKFGAHPVPLPTRKEIGPYRP